MLFKMYLFEYLLIWTTRIKRNTRNLRKCQVYGVVSYWISVFYPNPPKCRHYYKNSTQRSAYFNQNNIAVGIHTCGGFVFNFILKTQ